MTNLVKKVMVVVYYTAIPIPVQYQVSTRTGELLPLSLTFVRTMVMVIYLKSLGERRPMAGLAVREKF